MITWTLMCLLRYQLRLYMLQYNFYKWGARDGEHLDTPPFRGYNSFKKGRFYRIFSPYAPVVYSLLNDSIYINRDQETIIMRNFHNLNFIILSYNTMQLEKKCISELLVSLSIGIFSSLSVFVINILY